MPLFISDEDFRRCSGDAELVAEKADTYIWELLGQIETVKAEADAASITLEQNCSLVEQKYIVVCEEYSSLQSQHSELISELSYLQSEKQQLLLETIEKEREIERLKAEASEVHKSKRQLIELLEQKELEVSEKNATIKNYLDKILNLTENAASKDARLGELESELGRMQATSARLMQEKELLERHNIWLNEELTAKVDSLIQLRRANGELEAEMSSNLADVQNKLEESSSSLILFKGIVKELEEKLATLETELLLTNGAAAATEGRFSVEISNEKKLADFFKESSEEWSKKARELDGVINTLETRLNQVESEYKDKLEMEVSARTEVDKVSTALKEKLQTVEAEMANLRKDKELNHLPLSSFTVDTWAMSVDADDMVEKERSIIPRIPSGISGTAVAASLLRDGWTLDQMYAKYKEVVDRLLHEQLGRKQSETVLERVLYEIEEKAGVIMDEREEHEKLIESYCALEERLQHSLTEHSTLEMTIQELKASLKNQERDSVVAQKEINDLQKQVVILLKECQDVQLRCGYNARFNDDEMVTGSTVPLHDQSNIEDIISEQLLTFKDINSLVEKNVQLRSLVRYLSDQIEETETEWKLRAEEQSQMIESLHSSVAMYKKLYEEEHRHHSNSSHTQVAAPEQGSREVVVSQDESDTSRKAQEQALQRMKNLEDELTKSRNDIKSLQSECDNLVKELQFTKEQHGRFMKEFDHEREEQHKVLSKNAEFSKLIADYQKKLRESAESFNSAKELSQKLTMEVSILKHEKEILQNSEKKASEEAFEEARRSSESFHRLQASLITKERTEEVREEVRYVERRQQEDYINKLEREWAEEKKQLEEERNAVRNLTLEHESSMKNGFIKVVELSKELEELATALQSVSFAESRAALAEARCSDFEKIMESARTKDSHGGLSSSNEKILANCREEIEKLRGEAQSNKDHMLQYKSIAQANEEALKQMELARNEAEEEKRLLESKIQEAISATAGKEEAVACSLSEIASLKDDCSAKMSQIVVLESQISALKDDLVSEHQRWKTAQDNYERQVVLQSETIQELTKTSQTLSSAQTETSELRKAVDQLTTENSHVKSKWESERTAFEVYKSEADKKNTEVEEINNILHCSLEELHIKIAEKEQGAASGSSSQSLAHNGGLQSVVNYCRRSKEIAETQLSLLKQEKLRLQSSEKSAEAALTSFQSRGTIFNEGEFKSLKLHARELTLLRESNMQLRVENRHNFDGQEVRKVLQNSRIEIENLERLLKESDTELEACRKHLKREIDEQANLRGKEAELNEVKKLLSEKEKSAKILEKNLLERQVDLSLVQREITRIKREVNERESKIGETSKNEMQTKENLGDSANEEALMEKYCKVQTYVNNVEKHREDSKETEEEKIATHDIINRQEMIMDELNKHRKALKGFASDIFQAAKNFDQAAFGCEDSTISGGPPPAVEKSLLYMPVSRTNGEKVKMLSKKRANVTEFGREPVHLNSTRAGGRKRPFASSSFDLQEDTLVTHEGSNTPVLKKLKLTEIEHEGGGEEQPSDAPKLSEVVVAVDESLDDVGGANKAEPADAERGMAESNAGDENLDRQSETVLADQRADTESGDGEEGELVDVRAENDEKGPIGTGEFQAEQSGEPEKLMEAGEKDDEDTSDKLSKVTTDGGDQFVETEQDIQRADTESGDGEEGELVGDVPAEKNKKGPTGTGEFQAEQSGELEKLKAGEMDDEDTSDELSKVTTDGGDQFVETEQDIQRADTESSDGEEGELVGDVPAENDEKGPTGTGEFQAEQSGEPEKLEAGEMDDEDTSDKLTKFVETEQVPESSSKAANNEDASTSSAAGGDDGSLAVVPTLSPEGRKPASPFVFGCSQ